MKDFHSIFITFVAHIQEHFFDTKIPNIPVSLDKDLKRSKRPNSFIIMYIYMLIEFL